jgi:HK97 family phage major capsid protein
MDLVGPLYAELALNKVGATFLTGLVSDVSIPKYSGTNVGWAGEISAAADGAGTFSEVTLKPKRLTAYIDISKQFLLQDSTSAEMLLRSDIIEAIKQKLESTLLGGLIGSVTVPQGLFYDPATAPQVTTYNDLLDVEMKLLNNNASPKFYLASPLAYAKLRNISKPESAVTDKNLNISVGASIVDSNSVSGIPLVVNSNVYVDSVNNYGGYLIGDFSNYVIGQWGNIDLTVDPYSQAINGCVRLVVNAYFDAVLKRPTVAAALCV